MKVVRSLWIYWKNEELHKREHIYILNFIKVNSIGSSEYESAISETIECETGMNDFKNEQNLGPLVLNK